MGSRGKDGSRKAAERSTALRGTVEYGSGRRGVCSDAWATLVEIARASLLDGSDGDGSDGKIWKCAGDRDGGDVEGL